MGLGVWSWGVGVSSAMRFPGALALVEALSRGGGPCPQEFGIMIIDNLRAIYLPTYG